MVINGDRIRAETNRVLQIGNGIVQIVLLEMRHAAARVRNGIFGIPRNGLVKINCVRQGR
jgi:hypothetical protein